MDTFLKILYPLPEPNRRRDRPMQVLCLGISRSGTESLRAALILLGYDGVAHGFEWWLDRVHDSITWTSMAQAKFRSAGHESVSPLTRDDFDRVLGDRAATTDVPTVWFAQELLQAYPEAQVVLNYREDVEAWKTSFRQSVLPIIDSTRYQFMRFFQSELFWAIRLTNMCWPRWYKHDFERYAADSYLTHYATLEALLASQQRPFLRWKPSDGW